MQPQLLSLKDIEILINSPFPNEKAEVLANAMKDRVIIIPAKKSASLYILQENMTYEKTDDDIATHLKPICTKLIEKSFKALNSTEQELVKTKYIKSYACIFDSTAVSKYYNELYVRLVNNRITWDNTLCEIHFNNGYMDLKDFKYKQRKTGVHYITHYIDRDYKPSTKAQQEAVLKPLRQIYPRQEDLECIVMTLGSALSGLSSNEQDTLFLLGLGSGGKSTILRMTEKAIGCYFKELKSNTFSQSSKDTDKILNTYQVNPQIRISWINEMEDSKIDVSLFKTFCDGRLTTTVLYKEGSYGFQHYSKAIITANTMPNMKIDTGVSRRFRGYTHKSNFTDKREEVNESEHIYMKNEGLMDDFVKQDLMNAWFDIIASKCNAWLNGAKIKFTENFDETADSVILSNDWMQDFIDANLVITNDSAHRIGKVAMMECLNAQYPKKFLSPQQLLTCLKDKKIKYDPKLRCDKLQGCYVGVKFQSALDDTDQIDNGVDTTDYKAKYETLLKEYEAYKRRHETQQESDSEDDMDSIADGIFKRVQKK